MDDADSAAAHSEELLVSLHGIVLRMVVEDNFKWFKNLGVCI